MKKKPIPKVGDLVHINFYDHSEGDRSIEFEVIGRVIKLTRRDITVGCWLYVNDVDRRDENMDARHNEHRYTILRSTIHGMRILK